jgi:hypothetical protein
MLVRFKIRGFQGLQNTRKGGGRLEGKVGNMFAILEGNAV